MQVGAVSLQPYIYNTNSIGSASMNKVQPIPDDLTSQKTDYSGLVQSEEENINPLRRGESANLVDIIQSQMAMAQNNASRVMRPQDMAVDPQAMQLDGVSADMDMAANVDDMAGEMAEDMAVETNVDDVSAGIEYTEETNMAIETQSTATNANMNVDTEVFDTAAETYNTAAAESNAVTGNTEETSAVTEPTAVAGTVTESNDAAGSSATGSAAESSVTASVNTAASGTVLGSMENFTIGNSNTALVQEASATAAEASESTQPQARNQFTDMLNLFQMRRATEAYTLSMGM